MKNDTALIETFTSLAALFLLSLPGNTWFEETWPLGKKPPGVERRFALVIGATLTLYEIAVDGHVEHFRNSELIWKQPKVFFSGANKYFGACSKVSSDIIDWFNSTRTLVFSWSKVKPSDVQQLEQRLFGTTKEQSCVEKKRKQLSVPTNAFPLDAFIVPKTSQGERKQAIRRRKIAKLAPSTA